MQRDKPPGRTVGFGLTERDLPNTEGEQQGPDPESGIFARALHDNPLLKFFAVSASAMISGALAGQLVRAGGRQVGRRVVQQAAKPGVWGTRSANSIKNFRDFQGLLDEWQGVARTIKDPNDPFSDEIIQRSGFFFSEAEKANRRAGGVESAAEWTSRDEIQQRMVKLGRRLPYELPGAYLSQRIVTDKVLGVEEEGPDWTNPVDVIGDFAQQSMKNLAFAFLPFEAGGGAAVHGWRRAMTMNPNVEGGFQTGAQALTVGLNKSLKLVGHESSSLLADAVKKGSRSAGAAATALQESAAKSTSLVEQLHKMRHGEGGFKGWMDKFARNEEQITFGPFGHSKIFMDTYRSQYRKLGESTGRRTQSTMIERMAESLNRLGGTHPSTKARLADKARGIDDPFLKSEFYKGLAESEYRKLLGRRLSASGVDDQIAVEFANKAQIKGLPQQYNAKTVLDQRIGWSGSTLEGAVPKGANAQDYWLKAFTSKLAPQFGKEHAENISQALTKSVRLADAEFSTKINTFRDQSRNMWRNSYDQVIAPQAKATLGTRRQAYRDFGEAMTPANAEWLVRQSARRAGIPITGERGNPISTAVLRKSLSARGLDASDRRQLRAYLVQGGDISKPWNPQGFNILGLRAMSVQEGLDNKYFGNVNPDAEAFDPVAAQIKRLADSMKRTDYDSEVLDRLKVGGVFRTMNGGVVDFSPVTRAAKTLGQTLSNEFQIPFIHLKPAMLLGAGNRFAIENSPWIQFSPQYNRQPFLGAVDSAETAAGHFWFRSNRGTKGKVTEIGNNDQGFFARVLEGQYRPRDTDPYSMAGRYMRLAVGDSGHRPDTPRKGWRQWAAVDEYQPDSLLGTWRRFRDRKTDPRNVSRVARRYANNDLGPLDEATAFELIESQWRTTGSFGRNVVREAKEGTALHRNSHFLDAQGNLVSYLDAPEAELARRTRHLWEQSPEELGLVSKSQKIMHEKTRTMALQGWKDSSEGVYASAPAAMRPHGIHQRIDQWRMDLMRYSILTEGIRGTADEFSELSSGLLKNIDELRLQGKLRSQDVAEARAAVGSIQLNYLSMSEHATGKTRQELALDIGRRIRSSRPVLSPEDNIRMQNDPEFAKQVSRWSVASLLDDTANYDVARGPTGQATRRFLGRHLGMSEYDFPGTEINPFGGGRPQVYVPTFGTALSRNPRGAAKSAAGIGTWRDQENFSGIGQVSTHLLTRLDRGFFAPFGMSLDATQFSGPLDYFARGMVGKRMLPLFAGGATIMTADRTLGGMVNERDESGERVYSPFFLGGVAGGVARAQVGMAGALPGGQTAEEKAHELYEGEVPVRKGRWWPLGNTPWQGGRVQYYRPSWYQRLQNAPQYTEQTFGSPLERLAFGYDFSPLRPFDPYRFEREHYEDRPYPVTGEYFTGPWGPLNPVLNATIGRVLKPQRRMHEEETQLNLSRFQQVGMYGMASPSTGVAVPGEASGVLGIEAPDVSPYAVGGAPGPTVGQTIGALGPVTSSGEVSRYSQAAGTPAYTSGSRAAQQGVFAGNQRYTQAVGAANTTPVGYPFQIPPADASNPYVQAYARRPANVMPALMPDEAGDLNYQAGELAYRAQEFAGIYGFGFGAIRSSLGLGDQDYAENVPQLSQASLAYGSSRQFWDWNLGGLGDFPTPIEGDYANLQLSEVVRRFIPRPRRHALVNPIQNSVGLEHPWLPGNDYMTNFQWGDPYSLLPEGELRLPGQGYERMHNLRPDETGRYGRRDRFRILADVAPYSDQFRAAAGEVRNEPGFEAEFIETMQRVEERRREHTFTPYKYRDSSAKEMDMSRLEFGARRLGENLQHANTYFNTKFMPHRTAVEDWERNDVYGASFAQWQNPISDFLMPAVHRATQRNPIAAAGGLALVGRMMGATPRAKALGTMVGGLTGFLSSAVTDAREAITGERYIPAKRRRELAMEEYTDILQYVKASRGYQAAQQANNTGLASQFQRQMRSTMYGADLEGGTLAELTSAIPKRKREHFAEFLDAPEQDRGRILSTAGRLERRIYQRAWGMPVEQRPDLGEYFEQHELPDPTWEGWDPRMNMDLVKIKMIQNQGLDASQMGYYPQQVEEANLINLSYPDFKVGTRGNVRAQLEQLMAQQGMQGSVREITTPFPGIRLKVDSGVYA